MSNLQSDDRLWCGEFVKQVAHKRYRPPIKIDPRIAFGTYNLSAVTHFESILKHLSGDEAVLLNFASDPEEASAIALWARQNGYTHMAALDALASQLRFAALVTTLPFTGFTTKAFKQKHLRLRRKLVKIFTGRKVSNNFFLFDCLGKRQIRLIYGLGADRWHYMPWNAGYHEILVYGPNQRLQMNKHFPYVSAIEIGYPRLDPVILGKFNRAAILTRLSLDKDKQTLVWLPTIPELSSVPSFYTSVLPLRDAYNLVIRPHPLTELHLLKDIMNVEGICVLNDPGYDNAELFAIADWIICDYGGSVFGALYCDKNTLLFNVERAVDHEILGVNSEEFHVRKYIQNYDKIDSSQLRKLLSDEGVWIDQKPVRAQLRQRYFRETGGEAGRLAADHLRQSAKSASASWLRKILLRGA